MKNIQIENITVVEYKEILADTIKEHLLPLQEQLNFLGENKSYTSRELAKELKTSTATVNKLCREGKIECTKPGRDYIISHNAYLKYLNR